MTAPFHGADRDSNSLGGTNLPTTGKPRIRESQTGTEPSEISAFIGPNKTSSKTQSWTKVGHLVSVAEAAQLLGVSHKTITRWCQTGKLPAMTAQYGSKTTYKISKTAISMAEQARLEIVNSLSSITETMPKEEKRHSDLLKSWLLAMKQGLIDGKPYSERTISDYRYYVEPFLKRYGSLTLQNLKGALLSTPADKRPTMVKKYKALLCFGKYLVVEGYLPSSFLEKAKQYKPQDNKDPKRRIIDEKQLLALYKTCKTRTNLLIIMLLGSTGIRAAEACALKWFDIDLESGFLTVRKGKGGKQRRTGLTKSTLKLLKRINEKTCPLPEQYIFLTTEGLPFTPENLCKRISRLGSRIGIKVSPHVLRRAFVTINANKGRPLNMLQIACGHRNINTTMAYCRTTEEDTIKAMKYW